MIDFAVFILTHNRPNKIKTIKTLQNHGYTGPIYLLIDSMDPSKDEYLKKFENVVIFDKTLTGTDAGDNFEGYKGVVYARNASFQIAKDLGIKFFLALDDDYTTFQYRFNAKLDYEYKAIRSLDKVFGHILNYYKKAPIHSIALAQGGDFIGGGESSLAQAVTLKRKCMNSFFCSPERPFKFSGRINEDTTAYVEGGAKGKLFFTMNQLCLTQTATQTNSGGLTEIYLETGTYVKSFYSVMYQPSSVKVKVLQSKNIRLHHSVSWKNTVPMILREGLKKT